jgi:hypothetical protein
MVLPMGIPWAPSPPGHRGGRHPFEHKVEKVFYAFGSPEKISSA